MKADMQGGNEKKTPSRALVLVAPVRDERAHALDAPFLTQLTANARGFATYRAKRRADPRIGASAYRATSARSANTAGRTIGWL